MNGKSNNVKLFPQYRQISRDFLFFYTINVLFLTQIKKIDISAVVLIDTFYALFVVLTQVPGTWIVEKIGRRRGMILGNIFNCLYLITVINSTNLISLICAELMSSFAFSLKDIAEPAILNESIELEKEEKSKKFAKIQGQAISGYYILSAISMILSGFLFEINAYIPMYLSLAIVVITLIMSTRFVEPMDCEKEEKTEELSLKETIKFAIKSRRCRCILIFSGIFLAIISVLATYEISLLEELEIESKYIGIIFAALNVVSAIGSRKHNVFQNKFKNRTLTVLGILLVASIMISGFAATLNISVYIVLTIIILMYIIKYVIVGLYNVLLIKYLSNFTNCQIDTKIFAINSFCTAVTSTLVGIFASKIIENSNMAEAMIIFGAFSAIALTIALLYMKNRFGLEPSKYSDLEVKYDSKV